VKEKRPGKMSGWVNLGQFSVWIPIFHGEMYGGIVQRGRPVSGSP